MSNEEKAKRKKLFGKFSDGFQSLKPHFVEAAGRTLVEIPVTTFPLVKTPIHASYLVYLATFSRMAAITYWRAALATCKLTGTQPSLLLHPLDFLCGDDVSELNFFPGMRMPFEKKLALVSEILSIYAENFEVVSMGVHAAAVRLSGDTKRLKATVIGQTS